MANLKVPDANETRNALMRHVVGNKADKPAITLASTKSSVAYEKGILEFLRDMLGLHLCCDIGNIYYLDGGSTGPADNDEDGLTRATPKGSLTAALALCTSGNNDVIIVLNYGSAGRGLETSFPVTVSKDMVHIVGVGTPAQKWCTMKVAAGDAADTANPAIYFTGNRCSIHNMEIGGGDTSCGLKAGSLNAAANGWGLWVNDCWFGVTGDTVGRDGIGVIATHDCPYLTVTNCRFGGSLTRDGIRINGNATRGSIGLPGKGNWFARLSGGVAINATAPTALSMHDNVVALAANSKGAAITTAGTGGTINGNKANYGVTAMANDVHLDTGANDWILNYKGGITASMPSTS